MLTAPASPPCARSGATRRGSFPCPHRCLCSHSLTAPSTASPTASSSVSQALAAPATVAKHVEADAHIRVGFTWMDMKFSEKLALIKKLVVCSPNLVAAVFASKKSSSSFSQIAVCQPGASSWSVCAYDQCKDFEDMAFYEGRLYALTGRLENLLIFNVSQDPATGNPQVSRVGQVIKGDPDPLLEAWFPDDSIGIKKLYLVESCGTLLMVRRKVCCRITNKMAMAGRRSEFEVFKADFQHSRWVNVETLGDDQMLFLGRHCSRVVSASQYGMSGDQIFLHDLAENVIEYYFDEENTSVGVYDMRTGEVSSPLPMVWKNELLRVTIWLFPWD